MRKIHLGGPLFVSILLWATALVVRADTDKFPTDFAAADVNIGERLFLETRFSQFFFTNCFGNANAVVAGDPTVATLQVAIGGGSGRHATVPGPFAGQAINCRQCHIVDEEGYGPFGNMALGNRTYADFTRRSPVPPRDDGRTVTPRNSLILVDALIPRNVPLFLHNDGQFATIHDLIIDTLTGRNYGWKPDEYAAAVHHIASIIRNDNGAGYIATTQARGSRWQIEETHLDTYANVFSGFTNYQGSYLADPRTLTEFMISPEYRLDMRYQNATDEQVLNTVANLIQAYLQNLFFSQDTNGLDFEGNGTAVFNGSPFDTFLIKNNLPRNPDTGETPLHYARRLRQLVTALRSPQYVTDPADGTFTTHVQTFQFGATELAGLKIFLADQSAGQGVTAGSVGNCAACHSLPAFTDFIFHNTGAAQEEYDSIHGAGSFAQLTVPGLAQRQANYNAWLPPTPSHPYATGTFETPPNTQVAGQADLGLWNVYQNFDFPAPQPGLVEITPELLGQVMPQITGAALVNHRFIFSGTNATPGGSYAILASSSLSSTNWVAVATNTFDADGDFSFSAPVTSRNAATFYRLALVVPPPADVLPRTIALFKTPTLRDLGHSGPYLHTGRMDTLEQVLQFYQNSSNEARAGSLRNADPQLKNIHLDNSAIAPLAAFLRSLDEDYTD